ncbi:hypothetical protein H6A30_13380 [Bacteroides caecigallinarum]|uniref:hypothetical protein n=1 Tax=Bacteroides caecigallinarum TaxID=1411144 RepID=UPI00195CB694|nr:hypothetical protein [Bacteroides caecigallinarum]MBM6891226.1 hypothetical protein [Bacteroides caecigallinarum]
MKKTKYLVAALLLMGATTTFTSCIDNDEPAGITELRGAKAALLKAKAAVETANAAYIDAQTQYKLALVEQQKLLNENQQLVNQLKELEVQEKTARVEAAIAEIKAALEKNKLLWEKQRLEQEVALKQAQKDYDDAMAALELSKEFLSDDVVAVVGQIQTALNTAKVEMDAAEDALQTARNNYKTAVETPGNYLSEETLKTKIAEKEAALEIVTNKLTIAQEALEAIKSDDAYNAWLELKAEYNDKIDSLKLVKADKDTKKAEIIASNASGVIKDLQDAVKTYNSKIKVEAASEKDSTFTVSDAIKDNLTGLTGLTGFITYDNGTVTAKFKSTADVMSLKDNGTKADDLADYKNYETLMDNSYVFNDGDGSGYKRVLGEIDAAVKVVTDAKNAVNPNELAYAKEVQAQAKTSMDAAKKNSDALIKAWEDAVTAYNEGAEPLTKADFDAEAAKINSYLGKINTSNTYEETIKDEAAAAIIKLAYQNYAAYVATMKSYKQNFADVETISGEKALFDALKAGKTLIPEWVDIDNAAILLQAAIDAFGDAGIYNGKGVLVRPSDKEVAAAADGGAYGTYLASVVAYNTATDNVNKLEQFDKVIAQLNSYKSSLATLKTAYVAKYQTYIDAVVAAQKAVNEKVVTPIAELKIDAIDQQIKDIETIVKDITGTIPTNPELTNFDQLIKALTDKIYGPGKTEGEDGGLKKEVKTAKEEVLKAQKNLELFLAGQLSEQYVIEYAKAELDNAQQRYDNAITVFNYWNNQLKDLINKLYSTAE